MKKKYSTIFHNNVTFRGNFRQCQSRFCTISFFKVFCSFFFYFFQRFFFRFLSRILSRILRRILGRILGRLFFPLVGLLQMVTFGHLCCTQYQRHWQTSINTGQHKRLALKRPITCCRGTSYCSEKYCQSVGFLANLLKSYTLTTLFTAMTVTTTASGGSF